MSIRQIDRVWRSSPYKLGRLLVHLAVADFVNDDGVGFCSWEQIMGKTRLSRDTVASTLREMASDGYLAVVTEARRGRSTTYRMQWPDGVGSTPDGVGSSGRLGSDPSSMGSDPSQLGSDLPGVGVGSTGVGVGSLSALPSLPSVLEPPSIPSVLGHPHDDAADPLIPVNTEPERLAGLLADLIEANGSKRPNVTRSWLTELERMRRIDDRAWDEIEGAIRWSQADAFWRAHVMSPVKLREKFDTMRLQAQRAGRESTEEVVTRTARQAAERRAAHGGNMFT